MIEQNKDLEGMEQVFVYIKEQEEKLKNARKHDLLIQELTINMFEPDESSVLYDEIKGTRRVIFSLLLDLGMV